jgi:hypothetical protein
VHIGEDLGTVEAVGETDTKGVGSHHVLNEDEALLNVFSIDLRVIGNFLKHAWGEKKCHLCGLFVFIYNKRFEAVPLYI